jgi:hypothetical protein
MHGRRKAPFTTVMFLKDAKKNDFHFVCTWFEQRSDCSLLLEPVRDLNRYSPRSCLGTVDLKLIESGSSNELGNIFVFASFGASNFRKANWQHKAEAESRRRVNEEVRAKADSEAVQPAWGIVSRGPGKRRATALA